MFIFKFIDYLASKMEMDYSKLMQIDFSNKIFYFKKGDFLLREGENCSHSFFVESGLLRQYSIDSVGKEHTIHFAPENWFVTDRESMYFEKPSIYFIQALEDSTVFIVNQDLIKQLTTFFPAFTEVNNRLMHSHIMHLQKRINQLLSATAQERYVDFLKMYPNITNRVPQTLIASYLGITPESLSRVRRELGSKS